MNKELYVSSTPHETKVALVEDDQLAEVYFERENEYTLAGSIYKGRVTRVLPGMQSAFVDIGLERDAFLYVSDFLELGDDEDEEFGQVQLQPHLIDPSKAEPAPVEEEEIEEAEGEELEGEAEQAAAAPQQEEEGGARRWRGRRRRRGRRGGRDRFVEQKPTEETESAAAPEEEESVEEAVETEVEPEEITVEAEPEAEVPAAPAAYMPIVLPGESISKYKNAGAAVPETPEAEAEQQAEPHRSERSDRGERGGRFGRDRGRGRGRDREREREPREPEAPLPADYQPIVLPGESISKYRNVEPIAIAPEVPSNEAAVDVVAEEPIVESPHIEDTQPVIAESHEAAHAQPEAPQVVAEAEPQLAEPEAIAEFGATEVPEAEPSKKEVERIEQMNVAAIFGGEEAEPPSGVEASAETTALEEEAAEFVAPKHVEHAPTHEAGAYSPEGGEVEHEEIDEEESDQIPSYAEELDEYHVNELEEETLEAELPNGVLSEAVRESDEEAKLNTEEYDFNGGDEFEESEMVAEEGEEFDEEEEGTGRAELRAPAGTAAYQQRTERPGYERRGGDRRGRRTGGGRRPMRRREGHRPVPAISDLLKEGQEVLIQIAKEPIGKKGARITSHIALPGRFLVFMPTVNHIGVSRKISSDEERQRLKRIVASERENGHGGFIVRTAAANVKEDELRADIRFLKHLWHEIRTRAENSKAPSLIYHDLNLVERVLRDQVTSDFSQIWVDSQDEYERVVRFASRFQPSLLKRVKLYTKDTPLFEQFGIQDEINKSLKSKVWLKSGGYIVINQTEALVAIDINTGKYVGKTARLEDTIVKTNVDAIKEIVRQIRLRDLGGIIVIDFIDMDERKNRQKVMQALEEALKADRAPSKVLQFNDFGLVAITRKRVKQSLERTLGSPCPYCTATGFVKSVTTVCNEIFVEMKKIRNQVEKADVTLRVNPEVAKELKSNHGRYIQEFEDLLGRTVLVKSDPLLHQEQFDINF